MHDKIEAFESCLDNLYKACSGRYFGAMWNEDHVNRSVVNYLPEGMYFDSCDYVLLKHAFRYSQQSEPVLIVGETGTGKSFYARFLSMHHGKKDMVSVNCSMLTETLLESELFGHVAGAFTGADKDRSGRISSAAGNTIFLDEFQQASVQVQCKIKTLLEDGVYYKVGSDKPEKAMCRFVLAVNEKPENSKILPDLVFRIPYTIYLPSLRERLEKESNITAFFNWAIEHCAPAALLKKPGSCWEMLWELIFDANEPSRPFDQLQPIHLRALQYNTYQWPGNMREAINWIKRCAVLNTRIWPPSGESPEAATEGPEAAIDRMRAEGMRERVIAATMEQRHGRGWSAASIRAKHPKRPRRK